MEVVNTSTYAGSRTILRVFGILILLLAYGPVKIHAQDSETDTIYYTENGHAEFTSSVPLHTFTGTSEHLTGMIDPSDGTVDFYLDLTTLKTGIDRRDRDMYRTLNTDEHPFAEFTGSLVNEFDPDTESEQVLRTEGEFAIHGNTRSIAVEGTLRKTEGGFLLQAEWILLLSDYDIDPPGILFYRVTDEQEIRIEALLERVDRDEVF
ncbi:MAG: YceI family protein [Balneolaceae bacterium]